MIGHARDLRRRVGERRDLERVDDLADPADVDGVMDVAQDEAHQVLVLVGAVPRYGFGHDEVP